MISVFKAVQNHSAFPEFLVESRYEKAKTLLWGVENKVLMRRTKPIVPSTVNAL
jgi:hypothetical protein